MKTLLVDAWNTFVTQEGINHELKFLLDGFSNPKIIVTNADRDELISFGIINMPYPVFSLSHKPNKTDPEYFKRLLSKYNLTKDDVLYFEHNKLAVDSAKSLGIKTHLYNSEESLEILKSFLISNLK